MKVLIQLTIVFRVFKLSFIAVSFDSLPVAEAKKVQTNAKPNNSNKNKKDFLRVLIESQAIFMYSIQFSTTKYNYLFTYLVMYIKNIYLFIYFELQKRSCNF